MQNRTLKGRQNTSLPALQLKLSVIALASAGLLSSASVWAQAAGDQTAPVETVVVTGVKASLIKSLAIKRTSDQVVESIVAEDIGKLPDNNVVEALQRVTGIQVTNRSGGEVGTLSIRGLPDVQTTWNGRNIFTASGTQVALQDIPSTLVRQIDVYKTRDASQLENGIAGQIDVKSLRPFDFKGEKFSLLARETYLDPAKKWNPQLSALASNRWKTDAGDFGALVNVSMVKTDYRNESVTPGRDGAVRQPQCRRRCRRATPRCSASSTTTSGRQVPIPACPMAGGFDAEFQRQGLSVSTWPATPFSRATSRASASVLPPTSPCSGNRTTDSVYTLRIDVQRLS